jgi:hypothetical protein
MTKEQFLSSKNTMMRVHEDAVSNQDIDTPYSNTLYHCLKNEGMDDDDAFELSIQLSEYNYYKEELVIDKLIRDFPNSIDFILD